MNRNKAILSIFLILIIVLVAGATVYISSKVSQEQAIAPTAPVSLPRASEGGAECTTCSATTVCATGLTCDSVDGLCKKTDGSTRCWFGSTACNESATSICVASTVKTCTPDCSTACGQVASTISTCVDSCNVATTKACAATLVCAQDIVVSKKAYKYDGGSYAYTTEIDTVAKNQTFLYAISIENKGLVDATGVSITDTLNGEHQDELTFMDASSGCTYSSSDKMVTCSGLTVKAGETVTYAFKVKVSGDAVNGEMIKNTSLVSVAGTTISTSATRDLTISTVVGCNHTCTDDSECSSGLICDTSTNKCRKGACVAEDTCSCPVVRAVTARPTARPTLAATAAPTQAVTEIGITEAPLPTQRPVVVAEPTILPETGILDFPGVAAFGGGLMLAIVGILLAL